MARRKSPIGARRSVLQSTRKPASAWMPGIHGGMARQWVTRAAFDFKILGLGQGSSMLKAVSTYLYVKERLHPGILDGLARNGVQAIEIFAARQHLDYANRKAHVKEIAEWFRGSGIPLHSLHSPLYADYEWGRAGAAPMNLASTDRAGLVEAMDEVKRALEIAEQIPFRFLVQHLGLPNESFSEKKFESAMTSMEHLRAFAKPLGVRILLENIPNELSTPEKLMEFIQGAHFEDVGVCFDVGHAHMMGDIPQAFDTLKNLIRSTHIHDNAKDK